MVATTKTPSAAGRVATAVVGVAIVLAGLGWWLMQPYKASTPTVVAVVFDRSDSMQPDEECEVVVGLASRVLLLPNLKADSRILLYGTGDPSTAMEPVAMGSFDIPSSNRVMEGKGAIVSARKALLDTIAGQCKKSPTVTKSSPIFLSMKRAVEQLSARGCGTTTICHLFARTDGEETEEPWIRQSVQNRRMRQRGLPTALDNTNIAVTVCGFSETLGEIRDSNKRRVRLTARRDGNNAEFLRAVWGKVFTQPDRVVFEPFCPRVSE